MSEPAQLVTASIKWDGNTPSLIVAICDAEDLPRLQRWKWRVCARRGVIAYKGEDSQIQAASVIRPAWHGVKFANGDKLDLRRSNLIRAINRGAGFSVRKTGHGPRVKLTNCIQYNDRQSYAA